MIDPTPRYASIYLGEHDSGASRPQRFSVDGVGQCLVKFFQNPQGPRLLVNEFIGYSLADALGVAHPPAGVVEVEAALLPHNGRLELPETQHLAACTFEAGLHFYSQYLSPVDRVAPDDFRRLSTQNAGLFAGAVLLDFILNNWDRSPGNMNLILYRQGNTQQLRVIDFGHAFGGGELWEIGNLSDASLPPLAEPLPYAGVLEPYLSTLTERDFAPFLERLSALDEEALKEILTALPNEWSITDRERPALLNYLSRRARALPDYLRERLKKDVWWQ